MKIHPLTAPIPAEGRPTVSTSVVPGVDPLVESRNRMDDA
jgi:hypothetical protein